MIDKRVRKILTAKDSRYKKFIILTKPVKFEEALKDKDIDIVQLHSIQLFKISEDNYDILGFCGAFSWKNNTLIGLDGDSYSANMYVYGYEWFDTDDGKKGLDILVGNDW